MDDHIYTVHVITLVNPIAVNGNEQSMLRDVEVVNHVGIALVVFNAVLDVKVAFKNVVLVHVQD